MEKKKTIFITGVSSGFGRALTLLMAKKGWTVIGLSRNKEKIKTLKQELKQLDIDSQHLLEVCDITQPKKLAALVKKSIKQFSNIDVLVNNAGLGLFKNLLDTNDGDRKKIFETNVFSLMRLTQLILPYMIENDSGHIINISSVAGKRTWKRLTAYSASKFAVQGFSNALRRELKFEGYSINVSVVCPPASLSDFFVNAGYPNYQADHPGDYLYHSEDIAKAIYKVILSKRREVVISFRAKLLDLMHRLSPSFTEGLEDFLKRSNRKKN